MKNKLSFAQILQKKKSNNQIGNSRISANQSQSPVQLLFKQSKAQCHNEYSTRSKVQNISMPKLSQLMDQFIKFPNEPQQNYTLSFSQFRDHQFETNQYEQDFQTGVNPLDSFIMTQSYLNNQKNRNKNGLIINNSNSNINKKNLNFKQKPFKQFNINQICQRFLSAKQNKNINSKNLPIHFNSNNTSKYSSRVYVQSLEASQQQPNIEDSKKYGPTSPSTYANSKVVKNKQMLANTKIIQSQVYKKDNIPQNIQMYKSKKQYETVNIPRIQRSQTGGKSVQDGSKKLSRYQINNQQTQRKQQVLPKYPDETKQPGQFGLIKNVPHKSPTQDFKSKIVQETKSPINSKLVKKQSLNEQLLIGSVQEDFNHKKLDQNHQKMEQKQLSEHEKRIQNAKKQINQYLQIRPINSPHNLGTGFAKSTQDNNIKPSFTKNMNNRVGQIQKNTIPSPQPQIDKNKEQVNYSFAVVQQLGFNSTVNEKLREIEQNLQGIATKTRKQRMLMQQNMKQQEHEKMLSCIQYTQSEVDVEDNDKQSEESMLLQSKRYTKNKQVRLSIPQNSNKNKQMSEESNNFTLQKYVPHSDKKIFKQMNEQEIQKYVQTVMNMNIDMNQANQPPLPQPTYMHKQQSSQYEYSQMIQIIQVQPNGQSSSLYRQQSYVNNSDRSKLIKQQSLQYQASSIDIRVSDQSSEYCLNKFESAKRVYDNQYQQANKVSQMIHNQSIQIPRLNQTDFETISNISHPSPIRNSPAMNSPSSFNLHSNSKQEYKKCNIEIVEVESHQPVSSHDSINIQKHENNLGFIYRMRINSRNNSFTSDYNGSRSQLNSINNICGSNHSSLNINNLEVQNQTSVFNQGINMNKNRQDRKYLQVQVSIEPANMQIKQYAQNNNMNCNQNSSQYPVMRIDSSQEYSMYKQYRANKNDQKQYEAPSINEQVRVSSTYQPVVGAPMTDSEARYNRFSVDSISINQQSSTYSHRYQNGAIQKIEQVEETKNDQKVDGQTVYMQSQVKLLVPTHEPLKEQAEMKQIARPQKQCVQQQLKETQNDQPQVQVRQQQLQQRKVQQSEGLSGDKVSDLFKYQDVNLQVRNHDQNDQGRQEKNDGQYPERQLKIEATAEPILRIKHQQVQTANDIVQNELITANLDNDLTNKEPQTKTTISQVEIQTQSKSTMEVSSERVITQNNATLDIGGCVQANLPDSTSNQLQAQKLNQVNLNNLMHSQSVIKLQANKEENKEDNSKLNMSIRQVGSQAKQNNYEPQLNRYQAPSVKDSVRKLSQMRTSVNMNNICNQNKDEEQFEFDLDF